MLPLPDHGVQRSRTAHNSKLSVVADWVEGSVLLEDEELSKATIVDVLAEQNIYDDQDFAMQFLESVWIEIDRRLRLVGIGAPLQLQGSTLVRTIGWEKSPAYVFCIVLSLAPRYTDWHGQFGTDYSEQGELFEALSGCALRALFPHWQILVTGWSRNRTATIGELLPSLTLRIDEQSGNNIDRYAGEAAKDSGLDLLLFRPFSDRRPGRPIFLGQCASGANWRTKIKEPDLDVWEKLINFGQKPARAFSIPFALSESEFIPRAVQVTGLLLDRYRLLAPLESENEWLDGEVAEGLRTWLRPRVEWLQARAAEQRAY